MNNIAMLTAQPQVLKLDGKEYKIHPLTFKDLGELQSWIDAQFPDPFQAVAKAFKSGEFNYTQQQYLLREALEKATRPKHLIGTPEADELLMSVEGYKQLLTMSIRKGDPSFTEQDASDLFTKMTQADVARLETATNLDMVANDPKEVPLNIVPPSNGSGSATCRRRKRAAKPGTGGGSSTKP